MGKTLNDFINELLEIKEQYGGDIPLIHTDKNYELKGNLVDVSIYDKVKVINVKKAQMLCTDDFDHSFYTADIYKECLSEDENSIKALEL